MYSPFISQFKKLNTISYLLNNITFFIILNKESLETLFKLAFFNNEYKFFLFLKLIIQYFLWKSIILYFLTIFQISPQILSPKMQSQFSRLSQSQHFSEQNYILSHQFDSTQLHIPFQVFHEFYHYLNFLSHW